MKATARKLANLVRNCLKRRAEELNARNHGSTFDEELASYGKYFVLILYLSLVEFYLRGCESDL